MPRGFVYLILKGMPTDLIWNSIIQAGTLAVVLSVAVVFLWRRISKDSDDTKAEKKALQENQTNALVRLGEAVTRVEVAVRTSDQNNQAAIARLGDTVSKHDSKLDRLDEHVNSHSTRLTKLESGSFNRADFPIPKSKAPR